MIKVEFVLYIPLLLDKSLLCLSIYLQTLMSSFSKAASKEQIYLYNFSLPCHRGFYYFSINTFIDLGLPAGK